MAETMNFREKTLYRQIHPLKLATDIGVTPISFFFFGVTRLLRRYSSAFYLR